MINCPQRDRPSAILLLVFWTTRNSNDFSGKVSSSSLLTFMFAKFLVTGIFKVGRNEFTFGEPRDDFLVGLGPVWKKVE